MNSPLFNKLIAYSSSKIAFHMPGHKFGSIADIGKINLALLDNTEVVGMDNLYEADGVIKEAMELMSGFYKSKKTLFLTNGSTAGILASILSVCKNGEKIIVARNCHHSVWSALTLSGAVPVYISPKYLYKENLLGEITEESVRKAIEEHPDAKAVLIVSPTYEGIVSDISKIAETVHKYDKLLIVDEAHGAHFVIEENFPKTSIQSGADLVINSMHKTLPALTQSALLHICSSRINEEDVLAALRMVQTSSPSYMMMGLMDYIRAYILEHKGNIKENYIKPLIVARGNLKRLKHLKLIEFPTSKYDISKMVISTLGAGINGYKLAEQLDKEYDIMAEAALNTHIILMTTMADNKETLLRLEKALISIDNALGNISYSYKMDYFFEDKIVEGVSPREVYYAEKEWLTVDECEGRVIAQTVMLYPPGIPILCMGETIKNQHIKLIDELKEKLQGTQLIENHVLVYVIK